MSLRMHGAGILVGGEVVRAAVNHQRLLDLGKEDQAAHRRLRRRSQQAMIPSRVQADNAGGRKSAESVGLEPLQFPCLVDVLADTLVDADHAWTSTSGSSTAACDSPSPLC